MDDLLDLLVEYSKDKKKANALFFGKAASLIVSELSLYDEVEEINLLDNIIDDNGNDSFTLMLYSLSDRAININKDGLKFCRSSFSKTSLKDDEFDDFSFKEYRLLFYNSFVLSRLMHEFEHARQFKLAKNVKNFDSALFNLLHFPYLMGLKNSTYWDWSKQNEDFVRIYSERYDSVPEEKLADIKAYREILTILKPIISSIPDIEYFFASLLYDRYMDGYEKSGGMISSPTEEYLSDLYKVSNILVRTRCFNDEFKKLFDEKCHSALFERLSYGLPISLGEYTYMRDFREKDKIKTFGARK